MAKPPKPCTSDDVVEVPIPASAAFLAPYLAQMVDEIERLGEKVAASKGGAVDYAEFEERIHAVRTHMLTATLNHVKKR